ncbi:ras and Rab interactor 3 [Colossoma macropomum]|uniref:ras and Rab interactor 3 n=1 Tax=Colossoma macropomum TaxID=42526 RepID=UPI001863AFB8|nr:ras and Rab interactor 3 [Colossoma macropomum]
MLSSAPATAPPVLQKPTSPSSPSPLLSKCSPTPTSTSPPPLIDISVDNSAFKSTSPPLPLSPPFSNWKTISPSPTSSSPLNHKISSPSAQKPMSPQVPKPICPPLPAQQPSAIPKVSSAAMPRPPPRPSSKPSSPPLARPPPPLVLKSPVTPAPTPAEQPQKPTPPSISILDKLIKTCPVWLQLGMTQERAFRILNKESPGIFLVRRNTGQKLMIVSVRLQDQQGEPRVQEFHVKEEKALLYLEGSVLVFDNIFKLIAFYCVSRDILPFPLKLPQAIVRASKYEDMEVISTLGLEFWSSTLNSHIQDNLSKSAASGGTQNAADHSSSCEIQLSAGSDRLWYVNPIFIEEYCSSLPSSPPAPILRTQSLNTPIQAPLKYKRPPPLPPRPISISEVALAQATTKPTREDLASDECSLISLSSPPPVVQKEEGSQHVCPEREGTAPSVEAEAAKPDVAQPPSQATKQASRVPSHRIPPLPLRRRLSENQPSGDEIQQEPTNSTSTSNSVPTEMEGEVPGARVASLICLDDDSVAQCEKPVDAPEPQSQQDEGLVDHSKISNGSSAVTRLSAAEVGRPGPPVPPPRRKRHSQAGTSALQDVNDANGGTAKEPTSFTPQTSSTPTSMHRFVTAGHPKVPDVSLFSPEGGAPQPDHDSYSTSSTEEEMDTTATGSIVKRTPTIMLDRAKQRLSMVNFSTVFTNFMSADRKLQKRIVELARDGSTYFGNLVQDYRAYTLDTMRRHSSSTEMLQEIRQMITQLKSYLIQSTELQNLQESAVYTEEKLEVIIEAALCKSVLKPLREAIYNGLKDIHSRAGTLKRLKENQQIVLGTTTTDLGVTTGVPDTPVMEKIQVKLGNLHQEYSPQKKIDLLLKTCKIIYESMSVGCPGKAHGADDFLPVLMYVLARCNMTALLLDVEYMMELMDPALQLGEGSYYLTTTYGALEHIKNYDKQAMTRQLSLEIQDSIHRWERRRTLNKARASRSSVQDFINVSFLEAGSNTKTLGVRPNTTARDLAAQCAEKFEVLEPDSYCLSVLVDGHYQPLTPEEFPLAVKSSLHHSEPRKEYYFVYRHGRWPGQEPDGQTASTLEPLPAQEDSLI